MFVGECPCLWSHWVELGGACSLSLPSAFHTMHHLTPQGDSPSPDCSSSVFPNLQGQGCVFCIWETAEGSAPAGALGEDPEGSAPCVTALLLLGPVQVLRGCFGAGLGPPQALGVTTQIPHLGWPIHEFQMCSGSAGYSRGDLGALLLLPRRVSQVLCPPRISDG